MEENQVTAWVEMIFGIGLFCISIYILFSHSLSYNHSLDMVRNQYLTDHFLYHTKQENESLTLTGYEIVGSIMIERNCDIEIDGVIVQQDDEVATLLSYIDVASIYSKTYQMDGNHEIIKIIFKKTI